MGSSGPLRAGSKKAPRPSFPIPAGAPLRSAPWTARHSQVRRTYWT